MKVIHIFFIITVITIPFGYGQSQIPQVLNTSGSSSQNKGYSMEWNIGESALVNQMVSSDGSDILTNGFIQPLLQDIILPFTGIEFSSSSVRIYPNPTTDILQVSFSQIPDGKISIQLSNETGQAMYTHQMPIHASGLVEKINMKGFTSGIYMLYIRRLNAVTGRYDVESGSYKIIKL